MTALFSSALFLSALLVFLVQPMVAKMVLPRLGGTPAVWNTCVVFFQLVLLAGYAYAHTAIRWLGVRRQALAHVALLLLPLFWLPLSLDPDWKPPVEGTPIFSLLGVLASTAGIPFLAASTSAPLLQRWFAETDHPEAHSPFFLYAASNLGSLGALLAYPFAVEPFLSLPTQSRWWAAGYVVLIVIVALCAWTTRRRSAASASFAPGTGAGTPVLGDPITWGDRWLWLALAAVPSSLMLSVTTHVSTDIAAVPLLWIVPLALYLLTFVIAFARRPLISLEWTNALFPVIVVLPVAVMVSRQTPPLAGIPVHFVAFFAAALLCHSRLARSRPAAHHLTEFYLWMSIGGALGGLFNTLVAPLAFSSTLEYPMGLIAASLLRLPPVAISRDTESRHRWGGASHWKRWAIDAASAAAVFALVFGLLELAERAGRASVDWVRFGRVYALPFALILALWSRPIRFSLALAALLAANGLHRDPLERAVLAERTFYGQHRVVDRGPLTFLINGTTSHGSQFKERARRCEPTTYYGRTSPIGQVFGSFVGAQTRHRIGAIGLGTGTLASYWQPGQTWTFFEVSPAIRALAQQSGHFTYLRDCIHEYSIELGDARLSLARASDNTFDVLVFDAFTSDAIPVHLITVDAIALYLRVLSPDGLLAFHISNRYLDLAPVLGSAARRLGLEARIQRQEGMSLEAGQRALSPSVWVIMARSPATLGDLALDARWEQLDPVPTAPAWTDDYSDIVRIIKW